MKSILKFILPVLALAGALVVSYFLFLTRPQVEHQAPEIKVPLVTVVEVESEDLNIPVITRGTVAPGTEIQLVSEVNGQVLELSPNFANGGFFSKGEVLIKIDPIEYEVNIKRAEASKAQAYQAMLQADAERKARGRVKNSSRSALATYDIQYQQAKAQYDATVAELEAAKLQKQRTQIKAPFDGRVRAAVLNVGQFVRPGQQMGTIYAVDVAEVRLPLSDRQLSLVNVPMQYQASQGVLPEVTLREEYAGKVYTWTGQLIRSEGGLDERNRLLYVIARVDNPYAPDPDQPGRPELVAGTFVEAEIEGRRFEKVFRVPRRALRYGSQLWTVNDAGRLSEKSIGIIYKSKDFVFVKSGLNEGDKVVLSQMDIAVEGMRVRTEADSLMPSEPKKINEQLFNRSTESTEPKEPPTATEINSTSKMPDPLPIEPEPKDEPALISDEERPTRSELDDLRLELKQSVTAEKNTEKKPDSTANKVDNKKTAAEPNRSMQSVDIGQAPAEGAASFGGFSDTPVSEKPRVQKQSSTQSNSEITTVTAPKPLMESSE